MITDGGLWVPDRKEVQKKDPLEVKGFVRARLFGPDGRLKHDEVDSNIITQVGRTYLVRRALNITTLPGQVTGAKLGQGTTAEAVTGAGAALVTYIAASHKAIDGSFPTEATQGNG